MALMPLTLEWSDIVLRIALATLAGVLIGRDRGESGKAAGLRTTLLVCLAACLAMLQVNALLAQTGKAPGSFAVLDLMRLPLGTLSGVGFIGAGAILRKDGLVKGITTAATLWFVTVVGLCFGGGQLGLGLLGLALGMAVLWLLKAVERRMPREQQAELTISYDAGSFSFESMHRAMKEYHCTMRTVSVSAPASDAQIEEKVDVRWHSAPMSHDAPPFLEAARAAGAQRVSWMLMR